MAPRRFAKTGYDDSGAVRCAIVLAIAGVMALLSVAAVAKDDRPSEVRDLHYGVVLFHLYQDDFLNSVTQLQLAQQLQRLNFHASEAGLVEAGLLLSYGMHREAQRIYQELLQSEEVTQDQRNRVWFELAKIAYQRGFYDDALEALNGMGGKVSLDIAGDRRMLQAQALMARDEFGAAAELLRDWKKPERLKPYADFNYGVSLVRNGDSTSGFAALETVSGMKASNTEMRSLKDRANLDLGLALVRAGDTPRGMTFLEQVRMSGPMASQALLGAGWASAEADDYQTALVFWEALSRRDSSEHAVQRALLAVPYAYAKLGGLGTAAERYEHSLEILRDEEVRLTQAIESIKSGAFLQALADVERNRRIGGQWRLDTLPQTDGIRYITTLMATHTFREALRNYFDLRVLETTLDHWSDSMAAFGDILATRREGYASRAPRVQGVLEGIDLPGLRQRQAAYEQRYAEIEASGDDLALATDRELGWLETFDGMAPVLELLPNVPRYNELRHKHSLLHGNLLWRVATDYKPRLRAVRKELNELDKAILVAELRRESVSQALATAHSRFDGYDDRIADYTQQVAQGQERTRQMLAAQSEFLQSLALSELEAQHQALRQYIVQGQFALAQLYDNAIPPDAASSEE